MPARKEQKGNGGDTATLVQEMRETLQKRLAEINETIAPMENERTEIQNVLQAFKGARPARTTSGAPRGRRGKRMQEFLTFVAENPGCKVMDAARDIGIQPNYLYRIADKATDAGKVVKADDGTYTLGDASADPGVRQEQQQAA